MEHIIEDFTGTTVFDKSHLAEVAASLGHPRSVGQPYIRDANSTDPTETTSEDEEFTISTVSPTTARKLTTHFGWRTPPCRSLF